jgi:hypothetical protein
MITLKHKNPNNHKPLSKGFNFFELKISTIAITIKHSETSNPI